MHVHQGVENLLSQYYHRIYNIECILFGDKKPEWNLQEFGYKKILK